MLPGWYGTGSAVEQWIGSGDEGVEARVEMLRDLYLRWPFFRTVLSNMAQVLAKSDMGLAARYAELVADESLRERVFGKIRAEHDRTIAMQNSSPATRTCWPTTRRWPDRCSTGSHLEPLNHLQVELLRRYRAGEERRQGETGILLTMSGLASAPATAGKAGLMAG